MTTVRFNEIVNKDIPNPEDIKFLFRLAGQNVKPDVLKNVNDAFEAELSGNKDDFITDNRDDLTNILGFTDKKDEIHALNIMRAIFRRIAHEKKGEVDFSDKNLKSLTMDEICHLLGQKLKPSFAQIISWILIIEEIEMDGSYLVQMDIDDLVKMLKLNNVQKSKYEELSREMMGGHEQPQSSGGINANLNNAVAGIVSLGGNVKAENVQVTKQSDEDVNHKK